MSPAPHNDHATVLAGFERADVVAVGFVGGDALPVFVHSRDFIEQFQTLTIATDVGNSRDFSEMSEPQSFTLS